MSKKDGGDRCDADLDKEIGVINRNTATEVAATAGVDLKDPATITELAGGHSYIAYDSPVSRETYKASSELKSVEHETELARQGMRVQSQDAETLYAAGMGDAVRPLSSTVYGKASREIIYLQETMHHEGGDDGFYSEKIAECHQVMRDITALDAKFAQNEKLAKEAGLSPKAREAMRKVGLNRHANESEALGTFAQEAGISSQAAERTSKDEQALKVAGNRYRIFRELAQVQRRWQGDEEMSFSPSLSQLEQGRRAAQKRYVESVLREDPHKWGHYLSGTPSYKLVHELDEHPGHLQENQDEQAFLREEKLLTPKGIRNDVESFAGGKSQIDGKRLERRIRTRLARNARNIQAADTGSNHAEQIEKLNNLIKQSNDWLSKIGAKPVTKNA